MPKKTERYSAGILLYRLTGRSADVFLVHPGGPFWKNKDEGAWTIPKGEPAADEDKEDTARREFYEETGQQLTSPGKYLNPVRQKSGKWIYAWMVDGDLDAGAIKSNLFELEWPPKSGLIQTFPEVDRAAWFSLEEAAKKINPAQVAFLTELENLQLNSTDPTAL